MKRVLSTNAFERDYHRSLKRGRNLSKLERVVDFLSNDEPLPPALRDHALTGNWKGSRECHLKPNWLLIYEQLDDLILLQRLGTHFDFLGRKAE